MNNIVKQGIFTLILIFFYNSPLQAALYVKLDREQVNLGERFYLTVEVEGEHDNPPDLGKLNNSFLLSPAQRSVLTTHQTRQRNVTTRWLIALRAKHTGRLEIPVLEFQNQKTAPLFITVSEQLSQPLNTALPQFGTDLSINLVTDREQVYQNAQLLVTLDIFHNQPLPEAVDFIPPQLASGSVRTLDLPHTRHIAVNGEDYLHTQLSFAVFPHESGLIEITGPGLRLPEQNSFSITEVYADMPDIEVLAPAESAAEQRWLPSNNLFMSDTTHALEAHHSHPFIRQLLLTAVGTTQDRLPTALLDTSDFPHYQLLNRETEEHYSNQGITSQIHETWLIESTAPDELMHPALEILWWDTLSDQNRYIQLSPPDTEGFNSQTRLSDLALANTPTIQTQPAQQAADYRWVTGALIAVVLLVLGGAYSLVRQRRNNSLLLARSRPAASHPKPRQPPLTESIATAPITTSTSTFRQVAERSEHQAFVQLSDACQQNAGQPARSALILWAACFWPDKQIINTESIYQANLSQTLNYLLLDLEHHLRRPHEGMWQGDLLLEAVTKLRQRRNLR